MTRENATLDNLAFQLPHADLTQANAPTSCIMSRCLCDRSLTSPEITKNRAGPLQSPRAFVDRYPSTSTYSFHVIRSRDLLPMARKGQQPHGPTGPPTTAQRSALNLITTLSHSTRCAFLPLLLPHVPFPFLDSTHPLHTFLDLILIPLSRPGNYVLTTDSDGARMYVQDGCSRSVAMPKLFRSVSVHPVRVLEDLSYRAPPFGTRHGVCFSLIQVVR
ncbi:hypothetical protein EDB86DRAFT_1003227 [Lactarius hatsudake]|nr:hypothetical protein EDB86DRAFT_1003227 [Lactarius hatsudake]